MGSGPLHRSNIRCCSDLQHAMGSHLGSVDLRMPCHVNILFRGVLEQSVSRNLRQEMAPCRGRHFDEVAQQAVCRGTGGTQYSRIGCCDNQEVALRPRQPRDCSCRGASARWPIYEESGSSSCAPKQLQYRLAAACQTQLVSLLWGLWAGTGSDPGACSSKQVSCA